MNILPWRFLHVLGDCCEEVEEGLSKPDSAIPSLMSVSDSA